MEAMRWVGLAQANLFFAGPLQKAHEERNDRTTAAWRALDRLTQRLDDGILDYGDSCLPGDAPMTSMLSGGRRGRR